MNEDNSQNPQPVPSPAQTDRPQPTTAAPAPLPAAAPVSAEQATAGNNGVWMGAFEAIGQAFQQIKKNPQPLMVFIAVTVVLAIADLVVNGGYKSPLSTDQGYTSLESLTSLIFLLATPVYALALADRRAITVSDYMRFDLARYFSVFGVLLVSGVIWVLSIIPLLIAWIWTVAWFYLAAYVSVDQKLGPIAALKATKSLSENNKAKVWGVVGASLALSIVASLLSFVPIVGSVAIAVATVVTAGASAILYRWLQHNAGHTPVAAPAPAAPTSPVDSQPQA